MNTKKKTTRKETREQLGQIHLSCKLVKIIKHFFPQLLSMLKKVSDPRNQSYITYSGHVLLMVRILSSIFYISSMRKTSEEFNSDIMIENIGYLCGQELIELPYWETINNYLEKTDPEELQGIVNELVRHLIRCKAFNDARIRGKYWQIIIDGTQIYSSRKELDGHYLYRVHNKGTEKEYKEYYYYLLEAKLVLRDNVCVSIMTEFVENREGEAEKQDCELKACWRLMERLKQSFGMLPVCISADSLYACNRFFEECEKRNWKYILRFKEEKIPTVFQEYKKLGELENNQQKETRIEIKKGKDGKKKKEKIEIKYDYVNGIDYMDHLLNFIEYYESTKKYPFYFLTNLPVSKKNVQSLAVSGRQRWFIENHGFNTQKNHGYYLEHLFSHNYTAIKNHYYLMQIGHMISQIIEAWEKIWKKVKQSMEQKHRRLLEAWKQERIVEYKSELEKTFQVRFS